MRKVISFLLASLVVYCGYPQESIVRRAPGSLINGVAVVNVQRFPNTRKAIETNGPIMVLSMGDSLMTGINGLYQYVIPFFTNYYGYAGSISGPGRSEQNYTLAGGAAFVTANFAKWYATYVNLPNGGSVIYAPTSGSFIGNVIEVDYYGTNGSGSFNVQTNFNGGAFATVTAINTDTAGVARGARYRFTNTVSGSVPTQLKLVCTSGTVDILAAGVLNYGTNGGFIINDVGVDGQDLSQFMTTSTNITAPIFGGWQPQMIIYKCTDSASIVANNLPAFSILITNYCTNTDMLIVGINPLEQAANNADALQQNVFYYNFCVANGWSFFDGYSIFRDYATGLANGFLRTPADPHLTTAGNIFEVDLLIEFLGLFNGSRTYFNAPYSQAYTYGPLDMGGPGGVKGGGTITVRPVDSFSQFSGQINWLHGVTNGWFGYVPVSGGYQYMWRDHGNAVDLAILRQLSGSVSLIPGGAVGVPYSFGTTTLNEMWLNIRGSNIFAYGNTSTVAQVIGTNAYPAAFSVFKMTADGSSTNTSTTTNTIWGAGLGSRRLDANWFQVGRCLEAEIEGDYWSSATPGNTRFLVMFNTSSATNIAAQSLFSTPGTVLAGDFFRLKTKSTCRTTGASGTVATSGTLEFYNAGVATVRYFTNQVLTVDTTAQLTFDIASTNGATADSMLARNGLLMMK